MFRAQFENDGEFFISKANATILYFSNVIPSGGNWKNDDFNRNMSVSFVVVSDKLG